MVQRKHGRIAGRGRHFAVEVVLVITVGIHVEIRECAPLEQANLIRLSVLGKAVDRILDVEALTLERIIRFDDPAALGFELCRVFRGDGGGSADGAVHALPHGVVHMHFGLGIQVPHREQEHEQHCALIDALAAGVAVAEERDPSLGCTNGAALCARVVLAASHTNGDIAERESLARELGGKRTGGKLVRVETEPPHNIEQ